LAAPQNPGDLDRLFAQIKREKGKLDIVFANAGIAKYARLGAMMERIGFEVHDILAGDDRTAILGEIAASRAARRCFSNLRLRLRSIYY